MKRSPLATRGAEVRGFRWLRPRRGGSTRREVYAGRVRQRPAHKRHSNYPSRMRARAFARPDPAGGPRPSRQLGLRLNWALRVRRNRKEFCISPYGTTYIALKPDRLVWRAGTPSASDYCEAHISAKFSNKLAVLALAGAALFLNARPLSHSPVFRVSSGGAVVSALAVAAIFLYFTRPLWRRNTPVLMACSSAAFAGLWQLWVHSCALQSWQNILASRYLLIYVGVTFFIGALATHILDTPGGAYHARATGAFEACLRAIGIIAICISASQQSRVFCSVTRLLTRVCFCVRRRAGRARWRRRRSRAARLRGDAAHGSLPAPAAALAAGPPALRCQGHEGCRGRGAPVGPHSWRRRARRRRRRRSHDT